MPPTHSASRTRSKQSKLSFNPRQPSTSTSTSTSAFDSVSRSRPLSFTPSFSLSRTSSSSSSASATSNAAALPSPPTSLVKGKQRQIDSPQAADTSDLHSEANALWCDKHSPESTNDLAVHKNKIQDVRNWLTDAFSGRANLAKYRRVLVLTGPAGSAKTATLKALSAPSELDFDISEWQSHSSYTSDSFLSEAPLTERFSDFLARAGRFPALGLSSTATSLTRPAQAAPGPASRASPQSSTSSAAPGSSSRAARRVILVEDLPNVHHLPTKVAFNAVLEQHLASTPPAEQNCPIVIVLSENTPKEDDENWAGDSSGSGWRDRLGAILDVRSVLEEPVRRSSALSEIRFNPIAPTILLKGLKRIVDLEFPIRRSDKAARTVSSRMDSERLERPNLSTVQAVADSGTGDIRAAINCLQFLCGVSSSDRGTKRDLDGKDKPTTRSNGRSRLAARQLALISGRESSLALFHAIGRVLYNKRYGDPGQELEEQKIRKRVEEAPLSKWCSDDETDAEQMSGLRKRLERARLKLTETKTDRAPEDQIMAPTVALRLHYGHLQRRPSRVDVQDLWTDMPVDPSIFQLYLHQNYTTFTTDLDQCTEIMAGISDADSIRCSREEYRHASLTSYYGFLVMVHSTLLHLPSPVPRRNQKLGKATFWEVRKKMRETDDLLDDAKQWLAESCAATLDPLQRQPTRFGSRTFLQGSDDLLDVNRSDAGLGLESYSSLMRADRQSLATEIVPLLTKIQDPTGVSARPTPPTYFTRIARMRFDWAGVSDTAERTLEEHEIEHHTEPTGGEDEADLPLSQPQARPAISDAKRGLPLEAGAGNTEGEKLYLSDDEIEDFA